MDVETMSLTDPFIKLYVREKKEIMPDWQYVGQTETQMNNLDPDFQKSFQLNYYFEKQQ